MKKTKSEILKSVAVLGAVTAAGTVATTTAHADAVATNNAPTQAPVSQTNADQQLANLKSQQTANENAVAASNAATMSAASDAANKQIADINNQIANKQASDAAAHQAAINSQTNAINSAATSATNAENANYSAAVAKQSAENAAAIKSAEAGISTPAQKQRETAQENASYQNDANKLEAAHTDNVNKINSDYQDQEAAASQKITDAQNAAAKGQQDALANATKQVDGQIADANKAVNDAQSAVNNDQNDVKTKTDANNQANAAAKAAQSTLNNDQSALDAAKKAASDGQTTETTDKLNVPQDYINVWKEYNQNIHDWTLTKDKYPELWQRNHDADVKAQEMNKDFVASEQDKNTYVTLNPDGTLSRDAAIIATKYATELINPVREAIGENPYQITNASIDMTMENTKKYRAKGHNDWQDAHDGELLNQIAKEWGTDSMGESLDGDLYLSGKVQNGEKISVADLKRAVHTAVVALLFEGANTEDPESAGNGHTTDLLGVRYNKGSVFAGGSDFLGVDYDYDPVNHNGWVRFNSIADGHGAHTKAMSEHYIINSGTAKDKSIQGHNYDHIAVPTPDSQSDTAAKLQKQISDLTDKVAKDTNDVKLANSAASDAASALKAAQDKLSQDQKTLGDAQAKLNNLKQNRDKMIKDLVSDPSGSKLIQNLQDQLDAIKAKHAEAIKAENADYTAKLQTLKKNHEKKLAEIQAQPENVNGLKAQLQSKLDALKKDHEAKLAAIQNDAKTKIEALKKQAAANDPEIAKLQGQIDAIKDNLAKQQKKLDDQFAALKAKDEADYNALDQKLKNSSSEAAKGHNDHYNTGDGHEVVLPGNHGDHKTDEGKTTPSKPSDSQSSKGDGHHATKPSEPAKGDDHQNQTTPVAPSDNQGSKANDQEATKPAEPTKGEESGNAASDHEAVKPSESAKGNEAVFGNNFAVNNGAVKVSYPVDNSASVNANAPAATVTPMTREAVKAQAKNNGKSLPQTGNENGIVAMALGTMLAMFGLGVAAKKRY